MRPNALLALASFLVVSAGCSSAAPSLGKSLSTEGAEAPSDPGARLSEVASGSVKCSAADSYVVVDDGRSRSTLVVGRELVPGRRGAKSAFAEMVVHEDGSEVLHVEALDREGGSIALTAKLAPSDVDARTFHGVAVELTVPGKTMERDELVGRGDLVLTRFGGVGELVVGTLGPVASRSVAGASATVTVSLHVCRTSDWKVSI